MKSGSEALARLARGLQEDLAAVQAGLTLAWSNGPVEGQITRLKLCKRQAMAGLASPCSGSASCRPPKESMPLTTREDWRITP